MASAPLDGMRVVARSIDPSRPWAPALYDGGVPICSTKARTSAAERSGICSMGT